MQVPSVKIEHKKLAMTGPGLFQWQGGGWLGCVVGGSAWLIPTAGILAFSGQTKIALIPLGCCLIMNFVGCALWYRRDRVLPFHALIGILVLFSITTPGVWFSIAASATPESLASLDWPQSPIIVAMVLLLCPAIIVSFCIREYRERNRKIGQETFTP
jgi:hypothetical protein